MDIGHFRREYLKDDLQAEDLAADPVEQFQIWFEQAGEEGIQDHNAMSLATVDSSGMPSQRTVLLKYYDAGGFVFFTNKASRKAREIKENPQVSLLFAWLAQERQIIISGVASPVPAAESARYFMTRPKDSQIAAWVSTQSSVISSRQMLLQKFQEMKQKFGDGEIPFPTFWGGYKVIPQQIEFWQGRKSRLHDRFLYSLSGQEWSRARLAP